MRKEIITFMLAVSFLIFISGCAPLQKGEGICPGLAPGEWQPDQGECQSAEMKQKCDNFCAAHPDCCPGWQADKYGKSGGYGQTKLPFPSDEEVAALERNYPTTIKTIDEGPLIYSQEEKPEIMTDETLQKMKESGFNTVQVFLIGKIQGDVRVINEYDITVLLNDIMAIKNSGMAVWIALDTAGAPPSELVNLGNYSDFKHSYLNLVNESSKLMEKYKVEYLTVNNEPDRIFLDQTQWGNRDKINENLADFLVSTNQLARESFNGKMINKITRPKKHAQNVLDASFEYVDIAGVDVGPLISEEMSLESYKAEFDDYQFYASLAAEKNVPWMNAEYWQGDFDLGLKDYAKQNMLKYAQVSFDSYLETEPKGAGFTYNDFSTFSLEPQGEETRLAMKEFLSEI